MPHSAPLRLLRPAEPSRSASRPLPPPPTAGQDAGQRDRALVLDSLRVRDLGGPWLDHESFGLVEDHDAARSSLVRDGFAVWDEFGIHITPRGRRAWADAQRALRGVSELIEAA